MPVAIRKQYQSTTVRVPKHVYQKAKDVIERNRVSSFNEFVVQAIEEKVRKVTETEIDTAFAEMAQDPDYQRDSVALAQSFEMSDWEALESGRAEPPSMVDLRKNLKKSSSTKADAHSRAAKTRSR